MLNTGASADQELVSFASLGAKVKIGSLELGGEARNFAFLGDGSFKAQDRLRRLPERRRGDRRQLQVAELPADQDRRDRHPVARHRDRPGELRADALRERHRPSRASPAWSSPARSRASRSTSALLAQGKFPIIEHRLARRDRSRATMFGGEIDAGAARRHPQARRQLQHHRRPRHDRRRSHQRVFFLGIEGGFTMAGMAGFTIRVGLSELGPLSAFINVERAERHPARAARPA